MGGYISRITKKIPITFAILLYFHAGFEHLYPERGIPGTLAETKTRWCTGINGSQRLFRSPREEIVLSRERFIIGKNQGGGYFHKLPK